MSKQPEAPRSFSSAELEARSLGIRFAPFSHWPLAWHPMVMVALRQAEALSIRKLYIKEKLGGLRIQGGGAKLMEAALQAERLADKTCAGCGQPAVGTNSQMPLCAACAEKTAAIVQWVEP